MYVGFIGMGSMGQMLVTALTRHGALVPGKITVSNRSREKLRRLAADLPGLHVAYSNGELAMRSQVIFLCIKPGETKAVLDEIAPYITEYHVVVTITNTLDIPMLETRLPARIAKVIPSVVNSTGGGVSLLMFGERCTGTDRDLLIRLMGAISRPLVIQEEQARVASDLTSCGPAFLSYIFRAMALAARHHQPDLTVETVTSLVRHTADATCRLMEQSGYSFDDIIDKVSTPGGITADGIAVLDQYLPGVWEAVIETTIVKEEEKKARVEL